VIPSQPMQYTILFLKQSKLDASFVAKVLNITKYDQEKDNP
jgi:hypothetical protein